jgi:uncharacterized membrane protein
MDEELLRHAVQWVTQIVEILGILIILIGATIALVRFVLGMDAGKGDDRITCLRSNLGRAILLGLEFWWRRTSSTRSRSSRRWTA